MTIQEKIDAKQSAITSATNSRNAFNASAASWQRAADALKCDYSLKGKRERCQANRVFRQGKATAAKKSAATQQSLITRLTEDIESLRAQQIAENEATINLSTHGQSLAAAIEEAKGEADADRIIAEGEAAAIAETASVVARAEAESVRLAAKTEAENSSKQSNLFLIIGAVVVLIGGFIAYKKFK